MRTIKMLGLAVTAALMAMAFVGASSAMAGSTALCKVDESPCAEANRVTHVHEATLPGNEKRAKLLTNLATIQCHVLFLGNVSGASLNNPLVIIGNFTYNECNLGCSATEVSASAEIKVLRTAHELAGITGKGEVLLSCPGLGIHCVYNGKGLEGHGLGALLASEENGESRIEEASVERVEGTFVCPEFSKLDLLVTPLEKTYIST